MATACRLANRRARKLHAPLNSRKLLTAAGIKSPVRDNLRNEIWLKLWQNLSFNPVSMLTNGTLIDLANDPGTRHVIRVMMEEARTVGEALGVSFAVDVEERIAMAAKVGAHRTSMLQDVEAGAPDRTRRTARRRH